MGVEEGSKDAVGEFVSAAATEEIQIEETDEVDKEHKLWDALKWGVNDMDLPVTKVEFLGLIVKWKFPVQWKIKLWMTPWSSHLERYFSKVSWAFLYSTRSFSIL